MHPFQSQNGTFSSTSSIVVSQSAAGKDPDETSGDSEPVYVTVAVKSDRSEELDFLTAMINAKLAIGEKPDLRFFEDHQEFYFDSHHPRFYVELLALIDDRFADLSEYIRAYVHSPAKQGNRSEQEVKAIQTALAVRDLQGKQADTLLIDNGDRSTATNTYRAVRSLVPEVKMTNCMKLDAYYPTGLLANLLSHRLAIIEYQGESPLTIPLPVAKNQPGWGTAAKGYHSKEEYRPVPIRTGCGEFERGRAEVWYTGRVCSQLPGVFLEPSEARWTEISRSLRKLRPDLRDTLETVF